MNIKNIVAGLSAMASVGCAPGIPKSSTVPTGKPQNISTEVCKAAARVFFTDPTLTEGLSRERDFADIQSGTNSQFKGISVSDKKALRINCNFGAPMSIEDLRNFSRPDNNKFDGSLKSVQLTGPADYLPPPSRDIAGGSQAVEIEDIARGDNAVDGIPDIVHTKSSSHPLFKGTSVGYQLTNAGVRSAYNRITWELLRVGERTSSFHWTE